MEIFKPRMAVYAWMSWWALSPSVSLCALTVNPPLPIQKQLNVQIVQTGSSDGSELATVMGNSLQQAEIEQAVDIIWAQAGIDVNFLPMMNVYLNDFAFVGDVSPRPQSDLTTILNAARAAGMLHPDPSVLNMFFVDVVPGFSAQDKYSVSGIGRIAGNGTALYVGDSMLLTSGTRESVAGVIAHELGHNLGLPHTQSKIANLMSPEGTTDQLEFDQIATVLEVGAPWLIDYVPTADFTKDGWVNVLDLHLWSSSYSLNSNADSDDDGDSDGADFLAWQKQYSKVGMNFSLTQEIPEPQTCLLLLGLLLGAAADRRALRRPASTVSPG